MTGPASDKPRRRIGYISPHPLVDTLAYEFYLMAPPGTMLVVACIEIADYTLEAVEQQLPALQCRVEDSIRRGSSRIVISGVPIAVALGRARMRALLQSLAERWNVPVDTDLEAIIAAAHHLGLRRVGLATRWKPEMIEALTAYLAEADIEVVTSASSPRSMTENAGLDDKTGMALAMDLGSQVLGSPESPDGLIMPGGRWLTIDAIRQLEERFGKPVVTNYTAGLWASLRDGDDVPHGPGRLLATLGG